MIEITGKYSTIHLTKLQDPQRLCHQLTIFMDEDVLDALTTERHKARTPLQSNDDMKKFIGIISGIGILKFLC